MLCIFTYFPFFHQLPGLAALLKINISASRSIDIQDFFSQPPLIFPCMSQLYLEASWYRLCAGHVWSAGSPPRHPGRRWVTSSRLSFPLCVLTEKFARSLADSSFRFCFSEAKAFSCFTQLMKRMNQNFPHGGAMDTHFANMRSLIQVSQPQQGLHAKLL